jgi:hypothetical protein
VISVRDDPIGERDLRSAIRRGAGSTARAHETRNGGTVLFRSKQYIPDAAMLPG